MKAYYLLILFSIYITIQAQNYNQIVLPDAHWVISYTNSNNNEDRLYENYLSNDTLINGKTYKSVYARELDASYLDPVLLVPNRPYKPIGPPALVGAIREDTSSQEVFFIPFAHNFFVRLNPTSTCPVDEEFLLYDTNLEINDTLPGYGQCEFEPYSDSVIHVTTMDSIILNFSTYRIHRFAFPIQTISLFSGQNHVSGIGSLAGLLETGFGGVIRTDLIDHCTQSCEGFLLNVEHQLLQNFWRLNVEQSSKACTITWSKTLTSNYQISLYDFHGKELKLQSLQPQNEGYLNLHFPYLAASCYFLVIRRDDGFVAFSKKVLFH